MEAMAHFLHVIADLEYGGAQSQLLRLTKFALDAGDRVKVASLRRPGPVGALLEQIGAEVVWLRQRFAPDPLVLGRLMKLIGEQKPDAVQTWDFPTGLYLGAARPSCRWAHTVRETSGPHGWRNSALHRLLRGASVVLASDEQIHTRLVTRGVDQARLKVIPNLYADRNGALDRAAARELLSCRLGLSEDDGPVLGVVGRWDCIERVREVAWAADLVRVIRPRVRLVVAGGGSQLNRCVRFARSATAPGVVQFLGTREDWQDFTPGFDAIWCPSESSSTPIPLLEAMQAGTPVVAATAPGRESVIEEGATGWLTTWNDRAGWVRATEQILRDLDGALEVASEGAKRVSTRHAIETIAPKHRAILLGASQ